MKKNLLLLVLTLLPLAVNAHDIEVQNADGITIYYNYTNNGNGTELEVTFRGDKYDSHSHEYTGTIIIPEKVTYMNRTRKVTSISANAFFDCPGLNSVIIPSSVSSIGDEAFSGCKGLNSITIPEGVTDIGMRAFYGCTSLTSVTIPKGVSSIGYKAFYGCTSMNSVTISSSVASIESWAFEKCTKLIDVYCYAETVPSTDERAFNDSNIANATLHVPTSKIRAYKATVPWRNFRTISGIQ